MAKEKNFNSEALALVPKAIKVKVEGLDVIVPNNKDENALLNIVMASFGRAFLQRSLKKWLEDEQFPTPKELRDIAAAIKEINESCTAQFDKIELPEIPTRPAEKVDPVSPNGDRLDFSKLTSIDIQATDGAKTNGGKPREAAEGEATGKA